MKIALLLASLVLVAGSVAACGGGDSDGGDAPKSASTDAFCDVLTGLDDEDSGSKVADKLSETGTPKDMPDDARNGFEVLVEVADKAGDSSDDSEVEDLMKDISADDQADVAALFAYAAKTCTDLGLPTDLPS